MTFTTYSSLRPSRILRRINKTLDLFGMRRHRLEAFKQGNLILDPIEYLMDKRFIEENLTLCVGEHR
jgi:hypothetical protein